MEQKKLQSVVIDTIKSKSLKRAIEKSNKQFSIMELVKIAFNYTDYKQRIKLLTLISESINEKEIKKYISDVIKQQNDMYNEFVKKSGNCVYELHIKQTPDSYDERYLCESYESAREMISLFYKEYEEKETELAKYEIEKRRIFVENGNFEEDGLGLCTLNHKREICRLDVYGMNSCEQLCDNCSKLCISNVSIKYPRFASNFDIVKYTEKNGAKHFGVYLEGINDYDEEYYIIPLDCIAMKYHIFERDFYNHIHIEAPFVERADFKELPEDMKNTYKKYIDYLKSNSKESNL